MDDTLFDKGTPESVPGVQAGQPVGGLPRLRIPHRKQVKMHWLSLDELLEQSHAVRTVWDLVRGLDLSAWLRNVKAVEGVRGRKSTDPRLLVALWVYATIEGVASARELERRCETSLPYQWLCGEVTVNYHLLSDFRVRGEASLDHLLTQIVGSLMAEGLVQLERVAQDGMRVRASAGRSSFGRRERLEQCLKEAREQVETLKKLADEDPQELTRRQQAARARAACERQTRLLEALASCDEVEAQRQANRSRHKAKPALGSSTDAEARIMKMADGGYRPAYNVQLSTDVESGIIVGLDVVPVGSDNGQMVPLADQLRERYGRSPREYLADGGFASLPDIDHLETEHQCAVFLPIKKERKKLQAGEDPYASTRRDTEATARWRARMQTEEAKAIYKLRAQSAEWVNAVFRNHNLWRMPVRGRIRCRAVALWHALTHNLMRALRLRASRAVR